MNGSWYFVLVAQHGKKTRLVTSGTIGKSLLRLITTIKSYWVCCWEPVKMSVRGADNCFQGSLGNWRCLICETRLRDICFGCPSCSRGRRENCIISSREGSAQRAQYMDQERSRCGRLLGRNHFGRYRVYPFSMLPNPLT